MSVKNIIKKIRCASCQFAKPDKSASEGNWVAYTCTNSQSEFHKSLLNSDINGNKQSTITWSGCPLGVRKDSK